MKLRGLITLALVVGLALPFGSFPLRSPAIAQPPTPEPEAWPISPASPASPADPIPAIPLPGATPGWWIETVDSGGLGNGSSIALDAGGQPHISYYDFINDDLKYARRTDAGWIIQTVDFAGFVGAFNSIALDSSGRPHISYCSCTDNTCQTCNDLKYAFYDGNTWQIQWADSSGNNVGGYTSLVLVDDRPHISYYDFTTGDLKYTYKDPAGLPHWEVVDSSANDVGRYSSLAIGFGNRHIGYYDNTTQHLKYAYHDGSAWYPQTLDSTNYTGAYTSLDLCRSASPGGSRIAYFSNGDLKYAHKWIYGGWVFTTYNHDSPAGISIKLDPSCQVHISYYNLYNGDLKYFYWAVDGNHTEIIDDQGDSWAYVSSLALDALNRPHISYYDDSEDFSLRYAYKGYQVYLPFAIK